MTINKEFNSGNNILHKMERVSNTLGNFLSEWGNEYTPHTAIWRIITDDYRGIEVYVSIDIENTFFVNVNPTGKSVAITIKSTYPSNKPDKIKEWHWNTNVDEDSSMIFARLILRMIEYAPDHVSNSLAGFIRQKNREILDGYGIRAPER